LKIKGRKSNQQRLDRLSALSQICRRWSKDQKEEKKRKGKKKLGYAFNRGMCLIRSGINNRPAAELISPLTRC
jgi:hypothetical protein